MNADQSAKRKSADAFKPPMWQRVCLGVCILSVFAAAGIIVVRSEHRNTLFVAVFSCLLVLAGERLSSGQNISAQIPSKLIGAKITTPLSILAIFVLMFAAYFPTLRVNFNSDAIAYIHLFHSLSLDQFLHLFHSDLSQGAAGVNIEELRPFYGLSYAWSYALWHLNPVGYHIDGLLLHGLNALIVFLIIRTTDSTSLLRAALGSALFTLLPVHSENLGSINGSLTEAVPTLFYLLSFLLFVLFRRTSTARYLVVSWVSFAACILSKETAVTLPVMLVLYDLLQSNCEDRVNVQPRLQTPHMPWRTRLMPHVPFFAILGVYLLSRKLVFSSFLKEDTWKQTWGLSGNAAQGRMIELLCTCAEVVRHIVSIHIYNLCSVLLSFPGAWSGLALGILLGWAVAFHFKKHRDEIGKALFFGPIWYLVSTLPLLATATSVGHLYIPSVGPSIAVAFLAVPCAMTTIDRANLVRLISMFVLVGVFAGALWSENAHWAHTWNEMLAAPPKLSEPLQSLPDNSLVIVRNAPGGNAGFSWTEEFLPYALQCPFTSNDLYSRLAIIEVPEAYCCPIAQWWAKTNAVLARKLDGASEDTIPLTLVEWNLSTKSFQRSTRVFTKGRARACIAPFMRNESGLSEAEQVNAAEDTISALAGCE